MKMTYDEARAWIERCRKERRADPWWSARVALFYRMKLDVANLIVRLAQ